MCRRGRGSRNLSSAATAERSTNSGYSAEPTICMPLNLRLEGKGVWRSLHGDVGEMSVADTELRKMAEELMREMWKTLDTREGFATIIWNIRRKLTKFRRHYSKGRYDKALEEIGDLDFIIGVIRHFTEAKLSKQAQKR